MGESLDDLPRRFYTTAEAAQILHVSTRTIARLRERGELPDVRVMGCVRIPREAVEGFAYRQWAERDAEIVERIRELDARLKARRKETEQEALERLRAKGKRAKGGKRG